MAAFNKQLLIISVLLLFVVETTSALPSPQTSTQDLIHRLKSYPPEIPPLVPRSHPPSRFPPSFQHPTPSSSPIFPSLPPLAPKSHSPSFQHPTPPNFSSAFHPKRNHGAGKGGNEEPRGHGRDGRGNKRGGTGVGGGIGGGDINGGRQADLAIGNITSIVDKWVGIIAGGLNIILLIVLVVQAIRKARNGSEGG